MSWKKRSLGDLIKISKGRKHEPLVKGQYRYINIEDLHNPNNSVFANEAGNFVTESDLIIAWDGANAGKVGVGYQGVIGSTLAKLSIIKKDIDPRFLFWVIESFNTLIKSQRTGATIPHINGAALKDLQIPLPPLPIQKRIAEILDAADALKRKDQELLKKYDELAQAIFIDMFGDPLKNEKGWEVKKLGEIITIRRGASPRPIDKFIGKDVPWIKIGDGTKGSNIYIENTKVKITQAGSEKSVLLQPGSLIFANCGVSLGFARILKISGCIHDGWLSMENIDENQLNKVFLLKYINLLTDYFRKTAPEGTQPNLNSGIMKEHSIILPPIKLQNKFSDLVFALEFAKEKNNILSQKSDDLFNSLIQKAFKGELVT